VKRGGACLAVLILTPACLGACSITGERPGSERRAESSARLFEPIARVLSHPRCLNCHTVTDYPRQGNDRHPHLFLIARGPDDRGAPGKRCSECHQSQNQVNGVPGAPNWRLAPLAMAWEAEAGQELPSASLCRRLLDQTRNGNRDLPRLEEHLQSEPLVRWAWSPGNDVRGTPREAPPGSHEEFMRAFRAWEAAGAPCPG
jgi:hypothetical protein